MKIKTKMTLAAVISVALSSTAFAAPPPKPTLNTPANGATNVSQKNVKLSWSSAGATNFRFVISQNPSFSGFRDNNADSGCDGTCLTKTTGTATSYTKDMDLAGQTYYWKVRANNKDGASSWSDVRSFTTAGQSNSYGQSIWNEANRAYNNGERKFYKGSALTDGTYTYCAVFVRLVFDKSYGKGKDANAVCQDYENKRVMKKSGTPSVGAAVCYKPAPSNWNAGHIAIANGKGSELGVTSVSKGVEFRSSPSYWGWISADDYKSYY